MYYFLVEFDGQTRPAKVTIFSNPDVALKELAIREPLEPPGGETVLLGAESEEVLRVTHSRYFEDPLETLSRAFHEQTYELRRRLDGEPAATP